LTYAQQKKIVKKKHAETFGKSKDTSTTATSRPLTRMIGKEFQKLKKEMRYR